MTNGTIDPQARPAGAVTAFIGVGSNVGDRMAHMAFAFDALERAPGIRLVRRSTIHETAPVGPSGQGPYLNAVVELAVGLSPAELLATLLDIERLRGRDRANEIRFGPRTLDLDILTWGAAEPGRARIDSPGLVVPHPRMHDRSFVLLPLAELDPALASRAASVPLHFDQ